jgi:hypothetical protein
MFFQLYFYTVPFLHPSRLGSAARRLCIFFAYRWLPCDHGPSCTLAPCFVSPKVRVFLTPGRALVPVLARRAVSPCSRRGVPVLVKACSTRCQATVSCESSTASR